MLDLCVLRVQITVLSPPSKCIVVVTRFCWLNMLVLASGGQRGCTAVVEHGSIHEQGIASGSCPVSAVHVSEHVQARTQAKESSAPVLHPGSQERTVGDEDINCGISGNLRVEGVTLRFIRIPNVPSTRVIGEPQVCTPSMLTPSSIRSVALLSRFRHISTSAV